MAKSKLEKYLKSISSYKYALSDNAMFSIGNMGKELAYECENIIKENEKLKEENELLRRGLENACKELDKRTVISKEWWINWCLEKENKKV